MALNSREARLARVQRLLRERAEPRRLRPRSEDKGLIRRPVTYLFARGFFTRLFLLVIISSAVGSAATMLLPTALPLLARVPITCALLIGTVLLRDAVWEIIGDRVEQAWRVLGAIAALTIVLIVLALTLAPQSRVVRSGRAAFDGFVEDQRLALDAKQRARRIPVDSAAADGGSWRLVTADGMLRFGTFGEARAWCRAFGPEWDLPPGGILPDGPGPWPMLPRVLYAWTSAGTGVQIGNGQKPSGWVSSGTSRASEVHAVLCMRGTDR